MPRKHKIEALITNKSKFQSQPFHFFTVFYNLSNKNIISSDTYNNKKDYNFPVRRTLTIFAEYLNQNGNLLHVRGACQYIYHSSWDNSIKFQQLRTT